MGSSMAQVRSEGEDVYFGSGGNSGVTMSKSSSQTAKPDKSNKKDAAKVAKMDKSQKKDRDKQDGRVQFCNKDWNLLLNWCEEEGHLDAMKGTDKTTRVGSKYPTKRTAFDELAKFINEHQFKGSTLVKLNWEMARNRYNYLGGLYKKAKEAINGTGWGLTEQDEAKGIRTLEEKIEKICPCFDRVHLIFGGTPRTDLVGNTFVSALGGQMGEHLPWSTESQSEVQGADPGVEESVDEMNEELDTDVVDLTTDARMEDFPDGTSPPLFSPATPVASQSPLPVPPRPTLSPIQEGDPLQSTCDASEQSGMTGKVSNRAGPVKAKPISPSSFPNKRKHGSNKGQSVTGAFSSGMEGISSEKAKSNDIKERAYQMRFQALQADRVLRSENAQARLAIEAEKLTFEKQKLEAKMHASRLEVQAQMHTARLEVTMKVVNENKHRGPEELAAILNAFTANLPPLP